MLRFIAISIFGLSSFAVAAPWEHEMLLADEGGNKIWYVNPADPSKDWSVPVTENRSMQLVGENLVLVNTQTGFVEIDLDNGNVVNEFELPTGGGVVESALRFPSGDTWVYGYSLMDLGAGISLVHVSPDDEVITSFTLKDSSDQVLPGVGRTASISSRGTIYCGNYNGDLYEFDTLGNFLGRIPTSLLPGDNPLPYYATDWGPDSVVISPGFIEEIAVLKRTGDTYVYDGGIDGHITAGDSVKPNFWGSFQILANGNFVITNWVGHGPQGLDAGIQALEYSVSGELVSVWRQGPFQPMSLHGIMVLDGLNTELLHYAGNGRVEPFGVEAALGCTDPNANNYDLTATEDDGSCTYDPCCGDPTFTEYAEDCQNPQTDMCQTLGVEIAPSNKGIGFGSLTAIIHQPGEYAVTVRDTRGGILVSKTGTGPAEIPVDEIREQGIFFITVTTPSAEINRRVFFVQ
jgi:hypothetical protein